MNNYNQYNHNTFQYKPPNMHENTNTYIPPMQFNNYQPYYPLSGPSQNTHIPHTNTNDISLSPSDHIIYCFNRKFSNHTIDCSLLLDKLRSTFPFFTHGCNQWRLHEYRFVRRRVNQYYLQIEVYPYTHIHVCVLLVCV